MRLTSHMYVTAGLIAGMGLMAAMPAPADAAARCSGNSCTGKNPAAYTCANDARTVKSDAVLGPVVQLRYSPSCRAAWGRVQGGRRGDKVEIRNRNHAYYSVKVHAGKSSAFTPMVNDKATTAWTCLVRPNGNEVCTGGY